MSDKAGRDQEYDSSIRRMKDADGYAISGESEFSRDRSDPYEMVDFLIDQDVSYRGKGPRGFQMTDQRIFENVCEALLHSPELDASEIEVEVNAGTVILRGRVDDFSSCHLAEMLTQDLPGVERVENHLGLFR
jgi:hypothetical protein